MTPALAPASRLARALLLALALLAPLRAEAGEVTVFAAVSLAEAMDEVGRLWNEATGHKVAVALAASPVLARQIAQGAPADVFVSADIGWMDWLEVEGGVVPGSRVDLLGNALVLVAHGPEAAPVAIAPGLDLAAMLGDGRLAMALVDSVPAGIYGRAALESLDAWDQVASRLAQADNVRAALALVALGEAPLGVVYATDAVAEPRVSVVGTFPADSHPPIVYPAAVVAGRDNPLGPEFLAFLQGDAARAAFERQGFTMLGD